MMQYMVDDDCKEWAKLIKAGHIDTATQYVRRLSYALHLAMFISFFGSLSPSRSHELENDLESMTPNDLSNKWNSAFSDYIAKSTDANATFALHVDIMRQLDNIISLGLAERLGGEDGYNLLSATAKDSVITGFMSCASAYAPYTVQLLYEHNSVGPFYQKMTQCLYSTHLKDSMANFSTDTRYDDLSL